MSRTLKVGTRGSTLATTQAGHVRDALIAAGYPAELVIVRTRGDVVMAPVERIGVGVFTLELRAALAVSYTHLRAHETGSTLVCRLLPEKKKKKTVFREDALGSRPWRWNSSRMASLSWG